MSTSSPPQAASAPRTIAAFHRRIAELSDDMPKRLRQCAEYLVTNSDRIAVSTVAELAAAAHVQPSAMMRFCQLLGFSGFSEMQKLFRNRRAEVWPDYATRLENLRTAGAGRPAAILAEFVEAGRKSLERLANSVDPDVLDRVVATLARAKTIHIVGLRRSLATAYYLAYVFEKMEAPSVVHDSIGALDRSYLITEDDALIAITFAPYTQATVELAEAAVKRGAALVALTDTQLSPVWDLTELRLAPPEVDFGAFRSLNATLSLSIAIAVGVGAARAQQ